MAKYQKYAEYKDFGAQGGIPSHWNLSKVKYIGMYLNGFAFKPDHWAEHGMPIIRIQNLSNQDAEINRTEFFPPERYRVKAGDILISWSATLDVYVWNREDAWLNQHIFKVSTNKHYIDSHFFYWTAKWFMRELNESSHGSTMQHLTTDKFGGFNVPMPEIDEQKQIANFLDHETTKIDSLIEKQQQLIELLKEKRQAVISHAVTKGLNSDVPMKDSGVEWLGQVPEHWAVSLIKYQCREITDGAHISPDLENGEHYFVSIRDIKNGVINFEDALLTSGKSYQYLVHTGCKPFFGDILFSKDGTIGQTAITPTDMDFVVASSLIIIRPKHSKVTSEFLDLLLRSDVVQEQVESFVKGAALRRLSIQNLLKIWGVFPPLDEQKNIVTYVYSQLDKYRELESNAEKQVELLKERRTALISAAVTGKIDVRNWQAPNATEQEMEVST